MNCSYVRPNVVVQNSVLDGSHSQVMTQAVNRLHSQRAWLAGVFS